MCYFISQLSGDDITSARLESKQQFSPKKVAGNTLRVEFTAKIPAAMGAWPALWMMGSDVPYRIYLLL